MIGHKKNVDMDVKTWTNFSVLIPQNVNIDLCYQNSHQKKRKKNLGIHSCGHVNKRKHGWTWILVDKKKMWTVTHVDKTKKMWIYTYVTKRKKTCT